MAYISGLNISEMTFNGKRYWAIQNNAWVDNFYDKNGQLVGHLVINNNGPATLEEPVNTPSVLRKIPTEVLSQLWKLR